jgi:hypothetical protein
LIAPGTKADEIAAVERHTRAVDENFMAVGQSRLYGISLQIVRFPNEVITPYQRPLLVEVSNRERR